MGDWADCIKAFRVLRTKVESTEERDEAWRTFKKTAEDLKDSPPDQVGPLLDFLAREFPDRERKDIAILDHGCGGGFATMFLAARGYTNVRGVDVIDKGCTLWNGLLSDTLGQGDRNFTVYDGAHLPFEDNSVDLVFSQQVIEHVSPSVFETFYSEEARVLRPGGFAIHNVPHRLVPYESHTGTWLFHMLMPYKAWVWSIKQLGVITPREEYHLYLRWPWIHRRMARKYFGNVRDVTHLRLMNLARFEDYDGPRTLRVAIARICRIPVLGSLFAKTLSNFVMIDTVSQMRKANG